MYARKREKLVKAETHGIDAAATKGRKRERERYSGDARFACRLLVYGRFVAPEKSDYVVTRQTFRIIEYMMIARRRQKEDVNERKREEWKKERNEDVHQRESARGDEGRFNRRKIAFAGMLLCDYVWGIR